MKKPWHQRPDERDLDYAHFAYWATLRPRPPALDPALAIQLNWAERADAWDRFRELEGQTGPELIAGLFQDLTLAVRNEAGKLVRDSFVQDFNRVISPQEILRLAEIATDPERLRQEPQKVDLSCLTSDEARTLLDLHDKIAQHSLKALKGSS